jgi:adenosylhomocysteinase
MGANVIVTEIKPTAALKATLDGHRVMKMDEAAKHGDIFITATGMKDVIVKRHFESMKDGAVVCNTGHYDCEINIPDLEALAESKRTIRPNCEEYTLKKWQKNTSWFTKNSKPNSIGWIKKKKKLPQLSWF